MDEVRYAQGVSPKSRPGRRLQGLAVTAVAIALGLPGGVATASRSGIQSADSTASGTSTSSSPASPDIPELRTRFSSSYLTADGQVQAEISQVPVNFKDEAGGWQPIDSSLVPTDRPGFAAQNASNDFDVFIPEDVDTKPVRLQDDAGWITFNPVAATGTPEVADSSAAFDGNNANTDFEYQVEPTGLKESVNLAVAPTSAPTYHYTLQMAAGLTPQLDDASGDLQVHAADGSVAYTMPTPFMQDSSVPNVMSSDIDVQLTADGSNWDLAIRPDFTWLSDPARVYPVVIDPTVTPVPTTNPADFSGSRDCWIESANPTTSHCTSADGATRLWAGTDDTTATAPRRRSLIKFDLSSIPANVDITDATMRLNLDSAKTRGSTANAIDYVARRLTTGWTNNATWNRTNQSSAGTEWAATGAYQDTDLIMATRGLHGGSGEDGWQDWNLDLATVRGWYNGSISN